MEADGRHDLRLATGLIALFGLRPAELAVLTTKGDKLYAGAKVKRTSQPWRRKQSRHGSACCRWTLLAVKVRASVCCNCIHPVW